MSGQRQLQSSSALYPSFARMYADVTRALSAYVRYGRLAATITQYEGTWFAELFAGFDAEFQAWPRYPPNHPIAGYLHDFEQGCHESLRLAAHAFLHVAYDLPRVIADTLRKRPPTDRMALRSLFLRPAPLFREMMVTQMRHGAFGALLRPLGFLKSVEILGYWLLALRSVAWIHAESLADLPDSTALEWRLAQGMRLTGERARGRIERLDNSQLFEAGSAFALAGLEPRLVGAIALTVAATATATVVRARNLRLARRIDYFGALTYIESSKIIIPSEDGFPSERGALAAR